MHYTDFQERKNLPRRGDCNKIQLFVHDLHAVFHQAAGGWFLLKHALQSQLKPRLWHGISRKGNIAGGSSPCSRSPPPPCHMVAEDLWGAPPPSQGCKFELCVLRTRCFIWHFLSERHPRTISPCQTALSWLLEFWCAPFFVVVKFMPSCQSGPDGFILLLLCSRAQFGFPVACWCLRCRPSLSRVRASATLRVKKAPRVTSHVRTLAGSTVT